MKTLKQTICEGVSGFKTNNHIYAAVPGIEIYAPYWNQPIFMMIDEKGATRSVVFQVHDREYCVEYLNAYFDNAFDMEVVEEVVENLFHLKVGETYSNKEMGIFFRVK